MMCELGLAAKQNSRIYVFSLDCVALSKFNVYFKIRAAPLFHSTSTFKAVKCGRKWKMEII